MNKNIIFSNSKDEWYTPKSIIQKFGPFDLDVATTKFNLERLNIPMGYTKEDNGLQQEWNYKKVWCNPPFTLKKEFVDKAIEQHTKYNNDIYIYYYLCHLKQNYFINYLLMVLIFLSQMEE